MEAHDVIDRFHDTLSVKRVFGEPIQQDGSTLIPTALIRGGAGEGSGGPAGEKAAGEGLGYGLSARPEGVFIVREGKVTWRPAVNVNRMMLGFQIVAVVGLMTLGRIFAARRRRWR